MIGVEITLEGVQLVKSTKRKRNKGKSLLEFKNDYTIIDLETTGFYSMYDEIIEIAAIKVRDGEIIDNFHCFCDTEYLSDYITDLTGITKDMIKGAYSQKVGVEKIMDFIGDDIIIGHNVNFDINFLYDIAEKNNINTIKNDYIDLLRLSKLIFTDTSNHKLKTLSKIIGINPVNHHQAMYDCNLVYDIYNYCYEFVKNNYNSFDDFFEEYKKNKCRSELKAKDFIPNNNEFDITHPLYNKVCVFTGILDKMKRADAMQIVANLGGINADSVTKKTNYLILGNNDYCSTIKDGKSRKQKKAEELKLKGMDIEIIPEEVFYELLEI